MLLAASLTICVADHIQAQQTEVLVGMETAAYRTTNPYGGMVSLGAQVGLERRLTDQLSARATASALRGLRIADDISICYIAPDESCIPDPVFPLWLSSVEVLGAYLPVRRVPVRIIAGGGASVAGDARKKTRSSRALPLSTQTQAGWRAGLDVTLGSSRHAPRIQVTRMGFSADPFSLSAVDAVSIVFRP